ncbi:MAG: hypothetical protein D6761_06290 [Candidatus Dadabacteria bacterium]|nr:MAG: hypothetical protein D6761_06290 [Candidatus Dadabacteria bacterium]
MPRMLTRVLALAMILLTTTASAAELRFKVGTLAPDGTPWMDNLYGFLHDIEAKSPTPVKFVTYPGGVMGDEPDLVRKLKFNQLQVIAVTVAGLAQLVPETLVLSLPFLFNSHEEIDYVVEKMTPVFEQKAKERGFELIGLGDNGWINIYSKNRFNTLDELRQQKVWMWNGNPLELMFFEALGINGHPVGVPEVLIGLQTGLLDTIMTSSTGVVALQWNTELRYQHQLQLRYEPGGVIASKRAWDKIPAAQRAAYDKVVDDMVEKWFVPFKKKNRDDERMMTEMMAKNGVEFVEWSPAEIDKLRTEAHKVWDRATKELFAPEILTMVQQHLKEFRASHGSH